MIESAARLNHITEYYFSTKLKEIRDLNASGKDIINLGIGNPDLAPSRDVIDKAIEIIKLSTSHGYQAYNSIPDLRIAFSDWYSRVYNVSLNFENEILPLMGSKEGIMHLSLAFLNNADVVLIPDPGYPAYAAAAKICGARVIHYNLSQANKWLPDLNEVSRMDLSGVKIMWINYPNMPTGAVADKGILKSIVDFGRENNILIINDNPYSQILNSNPLSLFSVDPRKENTMELNSLSKTYNMAGWRVGMIAGSEKNLQSVLKVKSNIDSGMFLPVQVAAIEALRSGEEWTGSLNSIYAERRKVVYEILDRLGSQYKKDQAGLFVWSRLPEGYSSSYEYSDKLLIDHGVFITPGSVFGTNGRNYLRTSLCVPVDKLEESLGRVSS